MEVPPDKLKSNSHAPRFFPANSTALSTFPELRWLPSFSTSCIYLGEGISRGRSLVDLRLESLMEPARALDGMLETRGLPAAAIWRSLGGLAASIDSKRQLAQVALTKTIGAGERVERNVEPLTQHLLSLEAAAHAALPDLVEQLRFRVRPLQEQWEARGPGLLRGIVRLTFDDLLPESAQVVLVHPAFGGGGEAYLAQNVACLEAVLTNPFPELPEVVRLAWLIAQLSCDLPAMSETIRADRLPIVARLALLPPTLVAAQDVELVRDAEGAVEMAIARWNLELAGKSDLPAILKGWWQTVQDSRPDWRIALAGLDRMLGELPSEAPSTRS